MNSVTIHTGYGGLGDNLAYSSLPELYAKDGIDCYISSENPYRNPEIKQLVWDSNPYIKGERPLSREECVGHSRTGWLYKPELNSTTLNIEHLHGFTPTNLYSKLYLDYKKHQLNGAVIVDVTSVTLAHEYASVPVNDMVIDYLKSAHNYSLDDIVFLSFPHINSVVTESRCQVYNVGSLFEYADIIHGCKHYLSTHSGGNYLACTIKNTTMNFNLECLISNQRYSFLVGNGNQALFENCGYILWE